MPDFDLVRAYYFDPPSLDSRDASDEALIARYERRRFERCILRMGDPAAEGLGPHGSMIGGPGKPATLHHERAERTAPIDPLPLSWWDYPRARLRLLPPRRPASRLFLPARSRGRTPRWRAQPAQRPPPSRDVPLPPPVPRGPRHPRATVRRAPASSIQEPPDPRRRLAL